MSKIVQKTLFPVANFGTSFLSATKSVPKKFPPIIDKPLIQYAEVQAIRAGIDTLTYVTERRKRAVKDHFDANLKLEAVRAKGKHKQADMVHNIPPSEVECIFVRQAQQLGLGYTILSAEHLLYD